MARTCAFCGKGEVTKEHLFAKWVRDIYSDYADKTSALRFETDDSLDWSYQGDALDQGVKAFCGACNNGWMSRLEESAARFMGGMIRAHQVPTKMGYVSQGAVASWATKTAFVLQQLQPSAHRIPESYYRDFHKKQQPSSDVLVALGARHIAMSRHGGANLFEYKGHFVGRDTVGIHHLHFAVGAVYLGVIVFVGMKRVIPRFSDEIGVRLEAIWPIMLPEVTWPRPSIIDIGGVEGVADAFEQAIRGS